TEPPQPGEIPPTLAHVMAEVLGQRTATPGRCFFAFWDGWAGLNPVHGFGAAFAVPGRRYYIYHAPISAAVDRLESRIEPRGSQAVAHVAAHSGMATASTPHTGIVSTNPPSLWWPDDQAWCVATEIDMACTYVGCDSGTLRELERSALDVFQVQPNDAPVG
ncbi:MAG: hypothetical protein ACRDSE_06725, partial [Pseudonocardiaceae bacterium]